MMVIESRGTSTVKHSKLRIYIGLATLVMALSAAPMAFADSSAVETYGGAGGTPAAGVAAGAASGNAVDPGVTDPGSLPFTGLDVGLLIGGGLVLVLLGVGMARLAGRFRTQNT